MSSIDNSSNPSLDNNYNLDLHSRYAVATEALESFNNTYHIGSSTDTRAISDHSLVLDYVPKPNAFAQLFKVDSKRRWAYFEAPANFDSQRVFFFRMDSVAKDEADVARVSAIDVSHKDPQEQLQRSKEKYALSQFCELKVGLREDCNYIMGCLLRYVKG